MSAITTTGTMTFISTNGDGPQLLTEVAEFLSAFAQMGVMLAVEVSIKPVMSASKPAALTNITSEQIEQIEQNPTPAAPRARASSGGEWRGLSREQRAQRIHEEGRLLTMQLGHAPNMSEWDQHRMMSLPKASGVAKVYAADGSWATLQAQWNQSAI